MGKNETWQLLFLWGPLKPSAKHCLSVFFKLLLDSVFVFFPALSLCLGDRKSIWHAKTKSVHFYTFHCMCIAILLLGKLSVLFSASCRANCWLCCLLDCWCTGVLRPRVSPTPAWWELVQTGDWPTVWTVSSVWSALRCHARPLGSQPVQTLHWRPQRTLLQHLRHPCKGLPNECFVGIVFLAYLILPHLLQCWSLAVLDPQNFACMDRLDHYCSLLSRFWSDVFITVKILWSVNVSCVLWR